ncbi:hypothetical protein JOD54_005178 [Actinokineospora baliensis]|uniref:galactose-binding domain-containing protein n=1 Tax=Actinokineospora baliensis TaxID=547056 RepID=UPI00195B57D5|nr:hypothetical protein [Actinokineospora baliensis]MBM7774974.1 hypothetical protein [Actinokineospora baliensis]
MRFPAKRHIPAALALAGLTLLAVLTPSATATPDPTTSGAARASGTTTPTTPSPRPPCPSTSTTYTTYTTTPTPTTPTTAPPSPMLTSWPTFPSQPPRPGVNFALEGWAQSSSASPGYEAGRVNDNNTSSEFGCAHSWTNDQGRSPTTNPEWVQVRWALPQQVSRVVVITTDGYQLRDFDVQVLNQNEQWWDTVASVNYNTQSTVTAWFPTRPTRGVRVLAKVGPSHAPQYTRVNELQVFLY